MKTYYSHTEKENRRKTYRMSKRENELSTYITS